MKLYIKETKYIIGEIKLYIDESINLKEYYEYKKRNRLNED